MSYKHITLEERSCIYQFIKLGMKIREIARSLKEVQALYQRNVNYTFIKQ